MINILKKGDSVGKEQGWVDKPLTLTKQMHLHIGIYCKYVHFGYRHIMSSYYRIGQISSIIILDSE